VQRRIAIASVLAATVLVVLDAAIVNVALPAMAQSLQVTPARSVWIVTAYQTALLTGLLPCAALGESLGYRRVFTLGVAVFIGASGLCAWAPSLQWIVAARFVQGLGGAAVMALGVALLRFVVPRDRMGAAIGWNALAVALSAAAGPAIGAAILTRATWPWLFAVNVPLGILVLIATRALPNLSGTARRLDWFSVALNAGLFAAFVTGAELLTARPLPAAVLLAIAGVTLAALVRRETRKTAPLIPLDLLASPSFRISVIASVCCFSGVATGMVSLPFYLQQLGQDAWHTGLFMTPWPLGAAIAASMAGRLAGRMSTAWLCAAGGVGLAMGLIPAASWPLRENLLPLAILTLFCGLGFGLFQVSNNRNMFLAAPLDRSGAAGGMQGTARLAGQTMGTIVSTLLFTLLSLDVAPRIGLGIAAVLALAAGLISAMRAPLGLTSDPTFPHTQVVCQPKRALASRSSREPSMS
jgi:DHA2 family multidrug resistance protein-like MFS transporter